MQKQNNFVAREKVNTQTKNSHTMKQTKQSSREKANLETTINHNGLALTNINFKNLSETMGFRGRQDHYDASVDFSIFPDGRREQGGIIQRKSDKNETRRAEKSNMPFSSADVVDRGRRERSCWSSETTKKFTGGPIFGKIKRLVG